MILLDTTILINSKKINKNHSLIKFLSKKKKLFRPKCLKIEFEKDDDIENINYLDKDKLELEKFMQFMELISSIKKIDDKAYENECNKYFSKNRDKKIKDLKELLPFNYRLSEKDIYFIAFVIMDNYVACSDDKRVIDSCLRLSHKQFICTPKIVVDYKNIKNESELKTFLDDKNIKIFKDYFLTYSPISCNI